jgi:hypothetical protein
MFEVVLHIGIESINYEIRTRNRFNLKIGFQISKLLAYWDQNQICQQLGFFQENPDPDLRTWKSGPIWNYKVLKSGSEFSWKNQN